MGFARVHVLIKLMWILRLLRHIIFKIQKYIIIHMIGYGMLSLRLYDLHILCLKI